MVGRDVRMTYFDALLLATTGLGAPVLPIMIVRPVPDWEEAKEKPPKPVTYSVIRQQTSGNFAGE